MRTRALERWPDRETDNFYKSGGKLRGEDLMQNNIASTSDFETLRRADGLYVDKTGFLAHFFRNDAHPERFDSPKAPAVLFTRPRGFGKTLFLSMLASFFDMTRDSRELFAGLKAATHKRLCEEWMNRHPVIFLSFKNVVSATFEDALKDIHALLRDICKRHTYLLASPGVPDDCKDCIRCFLSKRADEHTLKQALGVLTEALATHHGKKAILLVDDYDAPLQSAAEHCFSDQMLPFLRSFLSRGLKTNSENLRLAVLAGIARPASLLEKTNNIRCHDVSSVSFSDLFGFTQDEVDALLAAEELWEVRGVVREWYGGYCFGKRTDICCPSSLMEYLKALRVDPSAMPRAHGLETGENSLAPAIAKGLSLKAVRGRLASLCAGHGIRAALNPRMDPGPVFQDAGEFWTWLHLSGFLSLAGEPSACPERPKKGESVLVIPNREIHALFEQALEHALEQALEQASVARQ